MTDRPITNDVGEELYSSLVPAMTYDDEAQDWALLWFCGAMGVTMQSVWELVQADDTYDGWLRMLDPDSSPVFALGYLGQFAGVELQPSWTEAEQREAIRHPAGFQRGTPAAMILAIQRTLTGSKDVLLTERYSSSAYKINFETLADQTPDTAATIAAAVAAKPGGLLLYYNGVLIPHTGGAGGGSTGERDYADVDSDHASYTTLEAEGTYEDVRTEAP